MTDDLLEQFVAEARDLLVEAGEDLLALERAPADQARINRLFRSVHTLKGSSCLFDLPALTQVLHAGEDLFQAVRERGLPLTPEMVDVTLSAGSQKMISDFSRLRAGLEIDPQLRPLASIASNRLGLFGNSRTCEIRLLESASVWVVTKIGLTGVHIEDF